MQRRPLIACALGLVVAFLVAGCGVRDPARSCPDPGPDPHSFANVADVAVRHIALELDVDFDAKVLHGVAELHIDNTSGATRLVLDSWDLDVRRVTLDGSERVTTFELGDEVEFLGRPLVIDIGPQTRRVRVEYSTIPDAIALLWLDPEQTASGRRPFLLTQSESVFARSWVPCQDSPSARFTYEAVVRVPPDLMALMSAENATGRTPDGVFTFEMPIPIPAYLLALVVGELEFRPLGERTGVYAEPSVVEAAAAEFVETERMLAIAEALAGPYRWGRYDMVVLPPSFPVGGMENPRLTFVTPTLIAGDRSLVSTVAHEIAHSWSGNLTTHATWGDLWLNEGLTNYLERRIMERVVDRDYVDMLVFLDGRSLDTALDALEPGDTHLRLDLGARDPEDSFGDVSYEKGYLFFRMLEQSLGREAWDEFLRSYFDELAFCAVSTDSFLAFVDERAIAVHPEAERLREELLLDAWIDGPGLPANRPVVESAGLEQVEAQVEALRAGAAPAELATGGWTTQHWLHFIWSLPALEPERLARLDAAFGWSDSGNAEILHAWLVVALRNDYDPVMPVLERFVTRVGRLRLIEPLYEELAADPASRAEARRIYGAARPGYHGVVQRTLDDLLGYSG